VAPVVVHFGSIARLSFDDRFGSQAGISNVLNLSI
jgi:hypothetical protein